MAISKGIDLAALMAGWGIDVASGGGMAAIAGTVAGAALVNTFLLPAHFATAIYGTSLYKPITYILTYLPRPSTVRRRASESVHCISVGMYCITVQ